MTLHINTPPGTPGRGRLAEQLTGIEPGDLDEPQYGQAPSRPANRKERRDFTQAQHREHRLAYGMGLGAKAAPGHFIRPDRGDKKPLGTVEDAPVVTIGSPWPS